MDVDQLMFSPIWFGDTLGSLWAQAGAGEAGGSEGGIPPTLLFMPLIFAVFYLLIIRPSQKQRKQQQEMLNTLSKGDQVRTTSGIYGTIAQIDDEANKVTIRIDDHARMTLHRDAIANKVNNEPSKATVAKDKKA